MHFPAKVLNHQQAFDSQISLNRRTKTLVA